LLTGFIEFRTKLLWNLNRWREIGSGESLHIGSDLGYCSLLAARLLCLTKSDMAVRQDIAVRADAVHLATADVLASTDCIDFLEVSRPFYERELS
jgi:hypothetical protein